MVPAFVCVSVYVMGNNLRASGDQFYGSRVRTKIRAKGVNAFDDKNMNEYVCV